MFEVEAPGGGIRITALGSCSNLRGGRGQRCYRLWVSMGGMWTLVAEGDADLPSMEEGYGALPFPAEGIVVPGGGGRIGICIECPEAGMTSSPTDANFAESRRLILCLRCENFPSFFVHLHCQRAESGVGFRRHLHGVSRGDVVEETPSLLVLAGTGERHAVNH